MAVTLVRFLVEVSLPESDGDLPEADCERLLAALHEIEVTPEMVAHLVRTCIESDPDLAPVGVEVRVTPYEPTFEEIRVRAREMTGVMQKREP